jgi:glycosyltransferase involved in cell wall biosynthesis
MQRVAMLVSNDVQHDARVQREAAALSSRYRLTVFGLDRGSPYLGDNGFEVRLIHVPARALRHKPGGLLVAYLQFAQRAIAALTRHRPDVLHAHDLDALIPSALVAARLRVPLIYDAHELYAERDGVGPLARTLLRVFEDRAMSRAAAILAANESRAEVMWREYRTPVQPVAIVNCPPAGRETIPPDGRLRRWVADQGRRWDRIVVYQGNFFHDRHLRELARSALLLPPNVGIAFIGTGPAGDTIRREGADRVLVHPLVPLGQLLPFIAGADVGVVTYANTCRNNYLCAPNKLFDYARVGLPIAAGDLPGLVRMVTDFDAGVIFANGDSDSMAYEITALLNDAPRLRRAGEGALRIARHFTWEDEVRKLLRVYERVLGSPSAATECGARSPAPQGVA